MPNNIEAPSCKRGSFMQNLQSSALIHSALLIMHNPYCECNHVVSQVLCTGVVSVAVWCSPSTVQEEVTEQQTYFQLGGRVASGCCCCWHSWGLS